MSETPRADACIAEYREGCLEFAWTLTDLARQLERELAQAHAELAAQEAASIECGLVLIKRAESAERRAEEATRVLQQLVAHDVAADKRQRLQNCFELDVARDFLAQEKPNDPR